MYSLVLPDGFVESKILPAVASLFSEKMFVSWLRMLLDIFPMVGKIVGDKLASEIVEKIIRRIGEAYYNVLERYCEEPDLAPESFEEIFKEQVEKICQSN